MNIKSKNFDFIKDRLPELAVLADYAESYVHSDPASCLVKLRSYTEQTVNIIYKELNITNPESSTLIDLMFISIFVFNMQYSIQLPCQNPFPSIYIHLKSLKRYNYNSTML